MKKLLLFCVLFASCKKEQNGYFVYPKGTTFTCEQGRDLSGNPDNTQIGWQINRYMRDGLFLSHYGKLPDTSVHKDSLKRFVAVEPFTIDEVCQSCYIGQLGYYVHSSDGLLFIMPELSMKDVVQY